MKKIRKIIMLTIIVMSTMVFFGAQAFADEALVTTETAIQAADVKVCFKSQYDGTDFGDHSLGFFEVTEGSKIDIQKFNKLFYKTFVVDFYGANKALGFRDNVQWASSDPNILEISTPGGMWTIRKTGTVTITAFLKKPKDYFSSVTMTFEIYDSNDVKDFDVIIKNKQASYKPGRYVNIEATATNNSSEDKSVLLITALYKNNKMVLHSSSSNIVKANGHLDLSSGFNLPMDSEGYKVKVFVWDKWYDPNTTTGGNALSDAITIDVKAQ